MTQDTLKALQCLYQGAAQPLVLDARPQQQFFQQRLAGSVNIPLLKLTRQCYLLPDKSKAFAVVVPSPEQYCATADESQHGKVLQENATAVFLKEATSLPDFLSSRGWSNVTYYLQDEPQLWTAAEHLSVLERGLPSDPQQLAQRCLFAPSGLLAASIDSIEAALLEQLKQQQQQHSAHDGCCMLRALDVGCGSGRDVAWLASRRVGLHAAQRGDQQPEQPDQQLHCPQSIEYGHGQPTQHSSKVRWHVTGVDEWPGALERAADLADAMQLTPQYVSLACGKVCTKTGQLQQLQVPTNSTLNGTGFITPVPLAQKCQAHSGCASDGGGPAGVPQSAAGFNLIMCCRFLVRAVLAPMRDMLAHGGFILYCTFLDLPGVRAFGRPSGSDHLLQPGELAGEHFGPAQGFVVLRDEVFVNDDGRELCWFMARKEL